MVASSRELYEGMDFSLRFSQQNAKKGTEINL